MFQWNMTVVHRMPLVGYQPLITIPNWEAIDQKTEALLSKQTEFPEVKKYLESVK